MIDRDTLIELYCIKKKRPSEIAELLKCSLDHINYCRRKYKIAKVENYERYGFIFTDELYRKVAAATMGDGGIYKISTNAHFVMEQGEKQKEYLYQKYENLKILFNRPPQKRIRRRGIVSYRVESIRHKRITDLWQLIYHKRGKKYKKRITQKLLNLFEIEHLTWWFMDDGFSEDDGQLYLCMCDFTNNDIVLMRKWLLEKFGLNTYVSRAKIVGFNSSDSKILAQMMMPYMCDCARYKIQHILSHIESGAVIVRKPNTEKEWFEYYRKRGFPYRSYSKTRLIKKFKELCEKDITWNNNKICSNTAGRNIAGFFARSIYKAHKYGTRSLFDAFNDDESLRRAIAKLFFAGDVVTDYNILSALRQLPGVATVSNFRPLAQKAVIQKCSKLLNRDLIVYDFSAGYGGRLIGSCATKQCKQYIATEPNTETFECLIELYNFLKPHSLCGVDLYNVPAEDLRLDVEVDLVFTSPPYYNIEIYSDEDTQSCNRYETYKKWLKGFLYTTLKNCCQILKEDGVLAINVCKNRFYNLELDLIKEAERLNWKLADRWILTLNRGWAGSHTMNFEYIYVFRRDNGDEKLRERVMKEFERATQCPICNSMFLNHKQMIRHIQASKDNKHKDFVNEQTRKCIKLLDRRNDLIERELIFGLDFIRGVRVKHNRGQL